MEVPNSSRRKSRRAVRWRRTLTPWYGRRPAQPARVEGARPLALARRRSKVSGRRPVQRARTPRYLRAYAGRRRAVADRLDVRPVAVADVGAAGDPEP